MSGGRWSRKEQAKGGERERVGGEGADTVPLGRARGQGGEGLLRARVQAGGCPSEEFTHPSVYVCGLLTAEGLGDDPLPFGPFPEAWGRLPGAFPLNSMPRTPSPGPPGLSLASSSPEATEKSRKCGMRPQRDLTQMEM